MRLAVIDGLKTLPEHDQQIIVLRFGLEMTQSEIAQHVGVSPMQISRLLRRALGAMRIAAAGDAAASPDKTGVA